MSGAIDITSQNMTRKHAHGGIKISERPKIVEYSDSDSASDFGDADVPGPCPLQPQTENDLARIVIELQHQYMKEVQELERRQEESERQLRVWKAQVQDRLQMQVNVVASIIKEVFGVDVADPTIREYTQGADIRNDVAETLIPPSSSSAQSAVIGTYFPFSERRKTSRILSPLPTRETPPKFLPLNETKGRQLNTAWPSPPSVRRSTGKKAPRARVIGASRRPYQDARKSGSRGGRTSVASVVESEQTRATGGIEAPCEVGGASATAVRDHNFQQSVAIQAGPVNPYDSRKYFSPLTVVGEDGIERPIFSFHRHPDTVEEQWAEFRYGLHGQLPVEHLEKLYRAKWRNGTYGRSWFTRRKAFWDKMKEMLAEGMSEEEALDVMRQLSKGSVPTLIAQLCKERGYGSRPDRRKSQPQLPSRKRLRGDSCDEADVIDSGAESGDYPGCSRSSPLRLRKRVVALVDGMNRDEEELTNRSGTATDGP